VFGAEIDRHARGWCCGSRTSPILPVPARRAR
jgi:hypothetical protein